MQKSMTGYGTATVQQNQITARAEVRSLNSKQADISLRMPRFLAEKETTTRKIIADALERGKIAVNLEVTQENPERNKLVLNRTLFDAYYQELAQAITTHGGNPDGLLRVVTQMPDVYKQNDQTDTEDVWEIALQAINQAIQACEIFRQKEGQVMQDALSEYLNTIEQQLNHVVKADPERAEQIRNRLDKHLSEIATNEMFDKNRFEQEIIYYLEKLDISEEKVRLKQHIDFFRQTLTETPSAGRKLNFICQEMGREINTIGSKANHAGMQQMVVEMKENLDKIKEQTANIL